MPEPTRAQLIEVAKRYGLVGCISGRQAAIARRIVALGSIAYVGNHGSELLAPGGADVEIDPEIAEHEPAVRAFATDAWTPELQRLRVRQEDKQAIAAFHWRGAPDEDAARGRRARDRRARRGRGPLHRTGAARCSRSARRCTMNKGRGVRRLLAGRGMTAGLYVGDDRTDLDAFDGLHELVADGELDVAVCVGVRSDETPPELEQASDMLVDGPPGVREMLTALLASSRRGCASSTSSAPPSCCARPRRRRWRR